MKKIIMIGLGISLTSGVGLSVLPFSQYSNISCVLAAVVIFIAGSRMVIPCAMSRSLSPIVSLSGYASSLIGMIQSIGAGIVAFILAHNLLHKKGYAFREKIK